MSFCERETMRSIRVVWALVCGVFLLAGLTRAAESPQVAEYTHHMAASKKVPGLHAGEHPLPLPTTMSHIEYEKILFPFIKSRAYATQLGWSHDKYVRDTGA